MTPQTYILRCKNEAAFSPCRKKSYAWLEKTVAQILEHEEYIGTLVNCRTAELEQAISGAKDKMLNADRFLKIVDKYTDIQELTPELVREFIEKIVVHDRSEPWKKKNTQQVDVYFNFVGKV